MQIPYRGFVVEIDKEKWKSLSLKKKLECVGSYFSEQAAYVRKRLVGYWLGWVSVRVQEIGNTGVTPDPVYEVAIYAGRHGDGQTFSGLSKNICQRMVDEWEDSEKKQFGLHISGGCISQRYDFSRYQKKILVDQLKPVLERQWYEDLEEE